MRGDSKWTKTVEERGTRDNIEKIERERKRG